MAIKLNGTGGLSSGLFSKGKAKSAVKTTADKPAPAQEPEVAPVMTLAKPSIKLRIHAVAAGSEPARPHDTIHASELTKEDEFCPREYALLQITGRKRRPQFIGTALRLTFDHGRALEYNLRNVYLRDRAFGDWVCGVCGQSHGEPSLVPSEPCSKCGYTRWEYNELRFKCPYTGASGGVDMLYLADDGLLRLVEIKSIDKDEFKSLLAPYAEHRVRTNMYMRIVESGGYLKGKVVLDEAHVLYVSKSFGFKDESMKEAGLKDTAFSPIKEFIIPRDDSLSQTPLVKAGIVTKFREGGCGIPAGVCPHALHRRAEKCSCVTACFGNKYPPTCTWSENGHPRHPDLPVIDVEVL